MRGVNNVALNHHVFVDEIRRVGVVGDNAANLCRRQIHLIDTFVRKECLHRLTVKQVQLVAGTHHDVYITALLKLTDDGRSHHPTMTGDKNTLFGHSQDSSAMATS
ncbi:hypothetical protein D3C80_987940 [compost metagenome]